MVGRAAAWDLVRRGHQTTVADVDKAVASATADAAGADAAVVNASDLADLSRFLDSVDLVVAAIPYSFGEKVAAAAIESGTHYLDFGGNPTIVAAQLRLDGAAADKEVAIVPDCGLAPGMANVLAVHLVEGMGDGIVDELRIRVGALPQSPQGALGYQWAFYQGGLINEYAEMCEVLENGERRLVEPLTGFEEVHWDPWGPLEAFNTAGGSSTLPARFEGRIKSLDYKTLRTPGHGAAFKAMGEIGLFDQTPQPGTGAAPRSMLLEALDTHLPRGGQDVVLVRISTSAERSGRRILAGLQVEDVHDGSFSALARTTAFPATALADAIVGGDVPPGARTMSEAIGAARMLAELEPVGITATPWPGPG